jgi:hypothetical protein
VLRELSELREDAAALAARLSRLRYRRAAGLPAEEKLAGILRAHPLAANADGLAQAREALADAQGEDPPRPGRIARLSALRGFLARARALALEPGAAQELFELPQRPLVRPPGDAGLHGARPSVAVERELPSLRSRDRRAELEEALAHAQEAADALRSSTWEAAQAAIAEAGLALPSGADAEKVLQGTDALAKDLGGWLLERHTGVRPHPGGAARHDVLNLIHAPHCAGAFPRGEMLRTVRRWAGMLRFDPAADNAIQLDEEDRPLKWPGAHAEPLDPPFEVAVTSLPEEGPRALGGLLAALSVAQLRAGPPGDAPPEDLWLGDPAAIHACAALLEGLVREPEFVRRCAKAELHRDDERAIAIAAVIDARVAAARTLASLQAHELGLGSRAGEAHRELFARATGADLPRGLALCDLDPFLDAEAELRGRALAARMRAFLRDRYDEDWWRNPRSLASLNGLWGRGGRSTAAELWAEVGSAESMEPLLAGLAEACR